jgi:hypothetical protein
MSSSDLMLAILALDSYDRGYDAGILMPDAELGDTEFLTEPQYALPAGSQAAGFLCGCL